MAQVEDMSMDEIDNLLKRAEVRLREAAALASSATELSSSTRFAQLKATGLPRPYVNTTGDVAQAEQKSLVQESQRKLAEKPRTVDDPIVAWEKKKEKGQIHQQSSIYHTISIPQMVQKVQTKKKNKGKKRKHV